ncbi:MAG TPA: 6-carboxytetrahydropterin synthase [Saprospiraceae bacterium]|nr:6-carboxytetrahydropterin synthase [Saprospiraceae bacterium]
MNTNRRQDTFPPPMIRITKSFTFEMAHALLGYDGACRNIHGHSYQLFVTVKGVPKDKQEHPKDGMVLDFVDLKKIIENHVVEALDHALVLNAATPPEVVKSLKDQYEKVILFPFQPTSENLVLYMVERILPVLPTDVSLSHVRLAETATAYIEWFSEDNTDAGV